MKIEILPTPAALAHAVTNRLAKALSKRRGAVLLLPVGKTAVPVYRELGRIHAAGRTSFRRATTFNLDELRIPPDDPNSFRSFMERRLFSKVDLPRDRIRFLRGDASDPERECARYERVLAREGPADVAFVGVGVNGHVAYLEPGRSLAPRTSLVRLSASTRRGLAADGARGAGKARTGDLVIGISASSVTPFVRGALGEARRRGAATVLITASRTRETSGLAEIVVHLDVGPEIVAGSTRLKAGTATKLALNQITTSALASAGKVFGPWMVDLRSGSAKLRDRALRIVAAACGVSPENARRLLARARGELRTAILMGRTGERYAGARRRLDRAAGDLRRALVKHEAASRSRKTSRRG